VPIILVVLAIIGIASIIGKVKISDKRGTQVYFGPSLLLIAVALFILMVKFPHG